MWILLAKWGTHPNGDPKNIHIFWPQCVIPKTFGRVPSLRFPPFHWSVHPGLALCRLPLELRLRKKPGKNQTPMKKPWMLFLGNSSLGTRASKEVNYIYTSYYHIMFLVHSWYWNVFPNTHAFSKFCGPGIPTNKGVFESYLNELGLCLNDFIDFHDSLEHLRSKSAPLRSRVLDHATTIPFSQAHLLGGHLSESAHVPQSCCHGVSGTWWEQPTGKKTRQSVVCWGVRMHTNHPYPSIWGVKAW